MASPTKSCTSPPPLYHILGSAQARIIMFVTSQSPASLGRGLPAECARSFAERDEMKRASTTLAAGILAVCVAIAPGPTAAQAVWQGKSLCHQAVVGVFRFPTVGPF